MWINVCVNLMPPRCVGIGAEYEKPIALANGRSRLRKHVNG